MSHAGPVIGPEERFRVTMLFSLLLHAVVILGIAFTMEKPAASLPSLDVILVPAQTESPPKQADFLANASQRGGGEHEKTLRPRAPVSGLAPSSRQGASPLPRRQRAPEPKPASPQAVLTGGPSDFQVTRNEAKPDTPKLPELSERELIERSMEMARLTAEIERQTEAYAKRPRRKYISANTQEYGYADYMRAWVARVERVGNLNYPEEARRRGLSGQLVLTVAVRRDGTVERTDIIQGSGTKLLDDAAVRIVSLATPFSPLPRTRDEVDVLHITRTWQFLPAAPSTPDNPHRTRPGRIRAMAEASFLTNQFLIAMPTMADPNFARGVTYVCQHTADGAMGLLINRLSDYRLGDVLAQMKLNTEIAAVAQTPVYIGGPVQPERGFVLHETGGEWDSSFRINERLAVTTSRDILVAVAEGGGPGRFLIALGYSGWSPGQLEQEMCDNAWLTTDADLDLIFQTPLDQRWSGAVALVGVNLSALSDYAGHA